MDSVPEPDRASDVRPQVGVGKRLLGAILTALGLLGDAVVILAQLERELHRTEAIAFFWIGIGSLVVAGCGRAIVHRHFWFLWLAPFVLLFAASFLLPTLSRVY